MAIQDDQSYWFRSMRLGAPLQQDSEKYMQKLIFLALQHLAQYDAGSMLDKISIGSVSVAAARPLGRSIGFGRSVGSYRHRSGLLQLGNVEAAPDTVLAMSSGLPRRC